MAVSVLDKNHKPLMPCSERRAKRLLTKKRARIHSMYPFVIRLVDRTVQTSVLQPVRLKIDPGSINTGVAIVLENGEKQTVLSFMEIRHRGRTISERLTARSAMRKQRRSKLRYRTPRFANRFRKAGWIAPSLQHRVDAVLNWTKHLMRYIPLTAITCETVRFDVQKLTNPEIDGVEYQQGTLFGYEIREYLLEKWGRKCVYCNAKEVPLQIDHIEARSCGGSNKIDNLTLACSSCNLRKGNLSLAQFAPEQALTIPKAPGFRDAAAVNSTRTALMNHLKELPVSFEAGTGGQTKYNRNRLGVPKTHALDAACAGIFSELHNWQKPIQQVHCTGRGSYQRTRLDRFGSTRGILTRQKRVHGFQTGDRVIAKVTKGKKIGKYTGRVAIRASGSFNIQTEEGVVQGISWKDCHLIQRSDGYHYPSISKKFTTRRSASSQS